MTTQALYLTWNTLNLPSHTLYMSSHPLCWRQNGYCVSHHRSHMYVIKCVIHDTISTLYDHKAKYLRNQMHYIHYITRITYDISSTLYDVTFTMCVTSHNDSIYDIKHYVYDIFPWYGITHSVMTTHPLCAFTSIMPDITLSVFLTWHTMYQFYEKCMYVITASIGMTPYSLHMTSHPLFMTSHHFIYDVKSTISNITSIISDVTYTVYV